MVSVSLNPSTFYPITAMINGMVAGALMILSLKIFKSMKVDDPVGSASVHGLMSFYALISICFFHKEEGFFFKDIYLSYISNNQNEIAPIIIVLGSNTLAGISVCALAAALTALSLKVMKPLMRISKVHEIIGQDTYFMFAVCDRVLKNHLFGIINAFYPEPTGEYAVRK
jgi:ammonia channel protein AmtB